MCDEFRPIDRHGTGVQEIGSIAECILDIPVWSLWLDKLNRTGTISLGIGPGGAGMLSDLRGHPAASHRADRARAELAAALHVPLKRPADVIKRRDPPAALTGFRIVSLRREC